MVTIIRPSPKRFAIKRPIANTKHPLHAVAHAKLLAKCAKKSATKAHHPCEYLDPFSTERWKVIAYSFINSITLLILVGEVDTLKPKQFVV